MKRICTAILTIVFVLSAVIMPFDIAYAQDEVEPLPSVQPIESEKTSEEPEAEPSASPQPQESEEPTEEPSSEPIVEPSNSPQPQESAEPQPTEEPSQSLEVPDVPESLESTVEQENDEQQAELEADYSTEGTVTTADGIVFNTWTGTITDYVGSSWNLSIDSKINNVYVRTINNFAFENSTSLRTVTIPNSVTKINNAAFKGCSNLESVSIPDSVIEIGDGVFEECRKLSQITMSNKLRSIGARVFLNCTSLTSLLLPDTVMSMRFGLFDGCSSLKNVRLPNNITLIDQSMFKGCESLENFVIPSTVRTIKHSAFYGCESLKSIQIPYGVTTIEGFAFSHCSSIKYITLPDSITSIGSAAFGHCTSLKTVDLPCMITEIGSLFQDCTNLVHVSIPDSITSIGLYAFLRCSSLEEISIPSSVNVIDNHAFYDASDNLIIYGELGSYAESYANSKGIPFIIIENINQNTNVEDNQYSILVIDAFTKNPISGASVSMHSESSATTDSKGYSIISGINYTTPVSREITVTKSGYYTFEATINNVIKGGQETVMMYSETGEPKVTSFYLQNTGENYLKTKKTVYEDENNGILLRYIMKAETVGATILEYRLLQNGEIIKRNQTGVFDIDFSEEFDPGYHIYAQVVDTNRKASKTVQLGIYVKEQTLKLDDQDLDFQLGTETNIPLPESIPFLGGSEVEIGFKDVFPCYIEKDDDKVKIYVGIEDDSDPYMKDLVKMFAKDATKKSSDFFCKPFSAGYAQFDGSVLGYGEGYVKNGNIHANIGMVIDIGGEYVYTWYTFVAPVPVPLYMQFKGGGGVEATFETQITYNSISGPTLNFGGVEIEPEIYIELGVGAGIAGAASVGIEGKAVLEMLWRLQENYGKVDLKLNASLVAKLGIFEWRKSTKDAVWNIYNGYFGQENNTTNSVINSSKQNNMINEVYDTNNYTFKERNISNDDIYNVDGIIDSDIVDENTFFNPMVRLIEHNDTSYLFWLTDDLSRDEKNRSMLVYSKKQNGIWTDARAINDDGTLDTSFDVALLGDEIHIVWTDCNSLILDNGDVDFYDYSEVSDISYAVLDTLNESISYQSITSDNEYDDYPHVTAKGNEVFVAWISNNEGEVFLNSGTNTVNSIMIEDGVVGDRQTVDSTTLALSSLDVGYLGSDYIVAYTLDEDRDFSTVDDIEIYYKKNDSLVVQYTNNNLIDSRPYFTSFDGEEYMMWYSDGNVNYTDDLLEQSELVFDNNQSGVTDRFRIIEGEDKVKLIWNDVVLKDDYEITGVYASNLNEDSSWSVPYLLAETGEQASIASGYIEGENCMLGYCYSVGDSVNVVVSSAQQDGNISASMIDFDSPVPDEELKIKVTTANLGKVDITNVDFVIKRNGEEIYRENIEADIAIGEEIEIETSGFIVPSDISQQDQMTAVLEISSDSDETDNSIDFILGKPDLFVEANVMYVDGEHIAEIKVGNKSEFSSDATLYVRADNEEGTVLKTIYLADINNDENNYITLSISNLLESTENNVIYFVLPDSDFSIIDNSDFVCIDTSLEGNGELKNVKMSYDFSNCSEHGASDGSITLTGIYGSGYYEYSFDGGLSWNEQNTQSGIAAGVYTVAIRDRENISDTASRSIRINNPINADPSDDGITDLVDLALIASKYNQADGTYDVNEDGIVNIYDLMLIAKEIE